jgi:hypothetical protein
MMATNGLLNVFTRDPADITETFRQLNSVGSVSIRNHALIAKDITSTVENMIPDLNGIDIVVSLYYL